MKKEIAFYPGEILVPKESLRPRFSVVACDQFTAQPEYWEEVAALAEGHPSAYHMIFPEAMLGKTGFDQKVASIQETTRWYLNDGLFDCYPESYIYLERTLPSGAVRKGLVGVLDLERYDYKKGSRSLVRATEGTVLDRIPPRVKIRQGAALEMPHVMLLVDDPGKTVVEPFEAQKDQLEKCYDFDLMMGGGHLTGWRAGHEYYEGVRAALEKLADSAAFNKRMGTSRKSPILFAVGDGNHSLAAAKVCWEELKQNLTPEEIACHPARWTLVEICNLQDESLTFEPIHRALFDVDHKLFLKELTAWAGLAPKTAKGEKGKKSMAKKQRFTLLLDGKSKKITIQNPAHTLTVGSVQQFLDSYLKKHGGRVDYIHGEDVLEQLSRDGAIGILLPGMDKGELFKTVALEGALPRKTFSMGEAQDKRYYLECRRI